MRFDPPLPCPGCRTSGDMTSPGPWQAGCCVSCDRQSPTLVCSNCRPEIRLGLAAMHVLRPSALAPALAVQAQELEDLMAQPSTHAALETVPADTRSSWERR